MMRYRNAVLGLVVGAVVGVGSALARPVCGPVDLVSADWNVTAVSVNGVPYTQDAFGFALDGGERVSAQFVTTWLESTDALAAEAYNSGSCSATTSNVSIKLQDPDTGEEVITALEVTP